MITIGQFQPLFVGAGHIGEEGATACDRDEAIPRAVVDEERQAQVPSVSLCPGDGLVQLRNEASRCLAVHHGILAVAQHLSRVAGDRGCVQPGVEPKVGFDPRQRLRRNQQERGHFGWHQQRRRGDDAGQLGWMADGVVKDDQTAQAMAKEKEPLVRRLLAQGGQKTAHIREVIIEPIHMPANPWRPAVAAVIQRPNTVPLAGKHLDQIGVAVGMLAKAVDQGNGPLAWANGRPALGKELHLPGPLQDEFHCTL